VVVANTGAAYVFVRSGTTWTQQAKLLASDGEAGDRFGISVSIDEDTALIGAPRADGEEPDSGSAYVFVRDPSTIPLWDEEFKLTASDADAGDQFGSSVFIDGDTALIGAQRGDGQEPDSGSAYVFVRDPSTFPLWTEEGPKLIASDGEAGDRFGFSVSLSGDRALIGAVGDDDLGFNAGAAYLFVRDDDDSSDDVMWTEEAKLIASDGDARAFFSSQVVSIDGDTALIGALGDDEFGFRSGKAYIFEDLEDDDSDS